MPDTTTLGVEEEYLLVDGEGLPVARSAQVLARARGDDGIGDADLQHELLEVQVEVATTVCTELADVREQLTSLRSGLAAAAAGSGCRLAAVGTAPLAPAGADPAPVTDKPRYRSMLDQAPALVEEQLINGMHVHVGVPDRGAGLAVLAAVRPWLPLLLGLSANSPFWRGRDSGFASFRAVHFARWPVEGLRRCSPPSTTTSAGSTTCWPPARSSTGASCTGTPGSRSTSRRSRCGSPTSSWDVDSAVVLAGLVRAIGEPLSPGRPGQQPLPVELLRAATWPAARHGLDGDLFDPRERRSVPVSRLVDGLLTELEKPLRELGDLDLVTAGVERVLREGNGAARQRAALAQRELGAVLELVAQPVRS